MTTLVASQGGDHSPQWESVGLQEYFVKSQRPMGGLKRARSPTHLSRSNPGLPTETMYPTNQSPPIPNGAAVGPPRQTTSGTTAHALRAEHR